MSRGAKSWRWQEEVGVAMLSLPEANSGQVEAREEEVDESDGNDIEILRSVYELPIEDSRSFPRLWLIKCN